MTKEELKKEYGQVWDTQELQQYFEVRAFQAPYITVTRRSDGKEGVMMFQDRPRFYFDFA